MHPVFVRPANNRLLVLPPSDQPILIMAGLKSQIIKETTHLPTTQQVLSFYKRQKNDKPGKTSSNKTTVAMTIPIFTQQNLATILQASEDDLLLQFVPRQSYPCKFFSCRDGLLLPARNLTETGRNAT